MEICVENSLKGSCSINNQIILVKDYNIIVRNDENFHSNQHNVFLISGGGSGHEPGHASYVGERFVDVKKMKLNFIFHFFNFNNTTQHILHFLGRGLLSAAVCGNIFTSPSVKRFVWENGIVKNLETQHDRRPKWETVREREIL